MPPNVHKNPQENPCISQAHKPSSPLSYRDMRRAVPQTPSSTRLKEQLFRLSSPE